VTPQEWLSTATRTDGGDWLESLTVSTPPRSGYDASRGRDSFTLVDGGAGDSGVRAAHNFGVRRALGVGGDHDSRGFRVAFRHQVQVPIWSITDLDTRMASSPFRPSLPDTTPVEGRLRGRRKGKM
jgi:hypothetical protein